MKFIQVYKCRNCAQTFVTEKILAEAPDNDILKYLFATHECFAGKGTYGTGDLIRSIHVGKKD